MKKLLSILIVLLMLISTVQAGTLTSTINKVNQKAEYIKADEFVTLLLGKANIKLDGIANYWLKASQMGLIYPEIKKQTTNKSTGKLYCVEIDK